jgi:toxin CcdB
MAQCDVYVNANPDTRTLIPYLLDVQTDFLNRLGTRVVVPLIGVAQMGGVIQQLHPLFVIEGVTVAMSTAELAGVPTRSLGKLVTSLQNQRSEIIAALDLLFTGV